MQPIVEEIRACLQAFDFRKLFIQELGWDKHSTNLPVAVDGKTFNLHAIAEKRGMQVFELAAPSIGDFPDYDGRRKIERHVAKLAHEHIIIYTDANKTLQKWQWVRREPGRPLACREPSFEKGRTGEALVQKLQILAVALDEEEKLRLVDVTGKARKAFDVDRVTKRFYDRFKTEHTKFLGFIKGITEKADREWYASLMLNRLMFIYFIQKKGFLDGDLDYLRNRLRTVQERKGKDKFLTFYQYFLLRLFQEGLGKPKPERNWKKDMESLIGDVPYLNGGLFEVHQLEKANPDIQIPDDAFKRLFDFFDAYQWHLDDRPLRKDDEINPDVLGYIFEKYINQKQMGAYYTKEDITGYNARNTIIPFLFNAAETTCAIAFKPDSAMWRLLREDPDRYIYAAMRHGVDLPLPPAIAEGVADVSKRKGWNVPATEEFALPTETWREHVARRQRCLDLRAKLSAGEVHDINDLITLNLDICQFAVDVIANCEGSDLLLAFWNTIQSVTVLDPTCGSGAFLFAALNILEPLYEACLERMRGFLEDLETSKRKHHPATYDTFRKVLQEANDTKRHPNHKYYVRKSIILNNLYGVDIMEEAVEICKLRLFLNLVAQVETSKQLEPLPDIDFNIRPGNTLVGFATLDEVERAMRKPARAAKGLEYADLGASAEVDDIVQAAKYADDAFRMFHEIQTVMGMSGSGLTKPKHDLRQKLDSLNAKLDHYLAGEYGVDPKKPADFAKWKASHQPFHWFAEFYGIMNAGGFDVIIGNPPYVEVPKALGRELLVRNFKTALERWSRDEDLYTFCVERSLAILKPKDGAFGMILPLSLAFSTKRPFEALRTRIQAESGSWWFSHFDRIPSALFGNEVRTRCTIAILARCEETEQFGKATTALLRWPTEFREHLFNVLAYSAVKTGIDVGIPKVGSQIQADALDQLLLSGSSLGSELHNSLPFGDLADAAPNFPQPAVYVGGTAYNWFPVWRDIPQTTTESGKPSLPARTAGYKFSNEDEANLVFALVASSLGYWWWAVASDGFNLKKWLLARFPLSTSALSEDARQELSQLGRALRKELKKHYVYKDNKGRIGNYYLPACAGHIDVIDQAIAKHVGALSRTFFEDIQAFNMSFSGATPADTEDDSEAD